MPVPLALLLISNAYVIQHFNLLVSVVIISALRKVPAIVFVSWFIVRLIQFVDDIAPLVLLCLFDVPAFERFWCVVLPLCGCDVLRNSAFQLICSKKEEEQESSINEDKIHIFSLCHCLCERFGGVQRIESENL